MKEEIKELDLSTMTESDVEELLDRLSKLSNVELKETVELIIDKVDDKNISDDDMPKVYESIFRNELVKKTVDSIMEEYDKEL